MKNLILSTLALLAVLAAPPNLPAPNCSTCGFNIPWHKVGPGGMSTGGAYAVSGSAGQLDAGQMSGGDLSLGGGFWVAASTIGGAALPAPLYNLVGLNITPDGLFSDAFGINNAGQIVGHVRDEAAFWTNSTSPVVLLRNFDSEPFSQAFGINNSNHIVGYSYNGVDYNATFWADNRSSPVRFFSPAGSNCVAYGINGSDQIVGYSELKGINDSGSYVYYQASLWSGGSGRLETGLGGHRSYAYAINDSGRIGGSANSASGGENYRAAFWDAGGSSASTLPGSPPGYDSAALGINASGQMVGYLAGQAVFWADSISAPVVLGSLGYGDRAKGVNASGQIVGSSSGRAVFWLNSTTPPIDLNTVIPRNSGWLLQQANAINDSGEIIGTGTFGGQTRGFALIPLPRPLAIASAGKSGTLLKISFTSQAGHTYSVLASPDVAAGLWNTLQSGIAGNGSIVEVTIPNAFVQPRRFFRIQAQ